MMLTISLNAAARYKEGRGELSRAPEYGPRMQRTTANRILLICTVVATVGFIFPITRLAFIEDEALNSYINGWIDWHHSTLWAFYVTVVREWILTEGRFMPLNLGSVYALFHLTQNAYVVKCVQVALIALNVTTLAVVVKRLSGTWTLGLLSAISVALTLQVRFSIDPIVGFAPLLPVTMEFVLLALACQLQWRTQRRGAWLVFAVLAYTAAALSYEVTYLYVLLFWYLAWRRNTGRNAALRECAAFALPLVILVLANLILRRSAHLVATDSYALALAPAALLRTYVIQTVAAIPLTYAAFDPIHFIGPWSAVLLTRPAAALGLGLCFGAIAFVLLRRYTIREVDVVGRPNLIDTAAVGAMLWFFAGPMMSASPRWQHELTFGQSYLPVYFEYFGVAILIATICTAATQRFPRLGTIVTLAACIGILTAGTYQFNRPTERAYLPAWTEGRFALEEAARDGLFDQTSNKTTIVLDQSYMWDFEPAEPHPNSNVRYLFYQLLGKREAFAQSVESAVATFCPHLTTTAYCDLQHQNVFAYFSDNNTVTPGVRWTRVVRIDGAIPKGDGTASLVASSGTIAARGAPEDHLAADNGDVLLTSRKLVGDTIIATAQACTAVSAADFPNRTGVSFGAGFYDEEKNPQETFRWSQRHSQISIVAAHSQTRFHLEGKLASYVPDTHVRISIVGRTPMTIALTPTGTPFALDLNVYPERPAVIRFALQGQPFTNLADRADMREFGFRAIDLRADQSCSTIQ
jgi:hypothetical protein